MTVRIIDCEQRSPTWFQARAGLVTGSVADAVVASLKSGGEPAARRDLRVQLAIERLTGAPVEVDGYVSRDMLRGIECEPLALAAYEAETGKVVRKTGFIERVDLAIGCSIDGDVDELFGILELKCPKSATHIAYLKAKRLPPEYVPQVTHNLLATEADYCDFCSFDNRLPDGLQFFRIRVTRADVDLTGYTSALLKFLQEVETEVESLTKLKAAA